MIPNYNTIRKIKSYNWNPQKDITTYELALCIPVLMTRGYDVEYYVEALPPKARRHFEEL